MLNWFISLYPAGLNVGLQNLASGLTGLQNVHVSIPGLPVPISLSVNPGNPSSNSGGNPQTQPQGQQSSHPVIIASPQHQHPTVRLVFSPLWGFEVIINYKKIKKKKSK